MQDRKHVAWLYGQLPELVRDGVLDAEAAERLHRRFGAVELSGRNRAVILFGILGAALIGGGIILLLAHNWEDLSRATRTVLSFIPLLAGQALCGWTLLRRADSTAWREGAGTFLTLAIGSSIALVAQTYHLGGSFEDFLLTWALLGLPVAYLMDATLPALLYLVAIVTWAGLYLGGFWHRSDARLLSYWGLLALVMPWWLLQMREGRYRSKVALFGWTLALTLPIGFFFSMERFSLGHGWQIWQSAFWTTLFLAGEKWWGEAASSRQRPLQTVGALGAVALALSLTFEDLWRLHDGDSAGGAGLVLVVGWLIASLALLGDALRRGAVAQTLLGALPLVAIISFFLVKASPWAAVALMNLYVFGLGVGVLAAGLRSHRLGTMNAGMMILSALILCRFFDADIGFVARGVTFILIGAGFLAANLLMLRKRGAAQ
ncbi:DUF2157 domain-containing protein [Methylocystis parvus]|uniref:DUF2157 domain-containing protein n=1 Tax=Methylocystis parvus TaxID=134 RepID=A0A6B8M9C8_9HYPH|nr:DUF2157 domain-containing protein [Methylocystis parvus]QGM99015.1 DUF2157 domain-containing protein [Methylocystis parvus]WBK00620.1 DUF2157 domain-containing protein [Methylocystis parvus OBBP]